MRRTISSSKTRSKGEFSREEVNNGSQDLAAMIQELKQKDEC